MSSYVKYALPTGDENEMTTIGIHTSSNSSVKPPSSSLNQTDAPPNGSVSEELPDLSDLKSVPSNNGIDSHDILFQNMVEKVVDSFDDQKSNQAPSNPEDVYIKDFEKKHELNINFDWNKTYEF